MMETHDSVYIQFPRKQERILSVRSDHTYLKRLGMRAYRGNTGLGGMGEKCAFFEDLGVVTCGETSGLSNGRCHPKLSQMPVVAGSIHCTFNPFSRMTVDSTSRPPHTQTVARETGIIFLVCHRI